MQNKMRMKTKKVAVVLLIAFALTMVCPVSAFAANFSDVPNDHWAIQQIDRMNARGIIVGYEDGTNRPNNPVTQFEALAMATRMMGLEYNETTHKGTYVSFKYPDWIGAYSVAVLAQEAGLVDTSDFNHSSAASREWIAKLLIKIMDAEDELNSVSDSLSFSDTNTIGSKYRSYVNLAYDKGLIGGYTDNTFKPKNTVTRAEMSAFLCRVEDKLNADLNNVVRGEVTSVTGVNVNVAGTDGKSYSLYATTNSVLYSNVSKKMGVNELEVGDSVYVVYKNNLLLYLEERNEVYNTTKPQIVTNLNGTISSVLPAKNIIVVTDEEGELQTVVVDKNTKINKANSNIALAFEDLLTDMPVRVSVDKDDQTANQIIIEETTSGQRSGTIHSVDVSDNVIVMDEKTGLVSYRMSKNIEVSISGMLTATTSSLRDGDQATYTVADGVMTAIAVGGNSENYGGNATVKTIDTVNRLITYVTKSGDLKAAYYNVGQTVKFKNDDNGTMSDLQSGDSINISVDDNKVTAITVTSRNLAEGAIKGTLYSVNTASKYIIVNVSNDSKVYNLADNVKVTVYGSSASLGSLTKGMRVELTMQGNEVTRIKANDMVEGVVKSLSTSADTIQVTTDNGTETYDVSDNLRVYFYKTTSYSLGSVTVGDTVSMKVSNDEVTEINVNEQVDMIVDTVYSSSNRVILEDSNGKTVYAYLDEADFFIDGVYTSDVDDLNVGDEVVATFAGRTLVKVNVTEQYSTTASAVRGEVTNVSTSARTITVKTANGKSETVSFTSGSYVLKNGSSSTSLSRISVGDRVMVSAGTTGKSFTVMSEKTGTVRYAISGQLQFRNDSKIYKPSSSCYYHKKGYTAQLALDGYNLTNGDSATIYYVDDIVYEIVKN